MKSLLYIICALAIVGCSHSDDDILSTPDLGVATSICVTTNLDVITRANLETDQSFYLYIDQDEQEYDYYLMMKYDDSTWKAYDAEGQNLINKITLLNSNPEITAICIGEKSLTEAEFTALTSYDDSNDIYFVSNTTNGLGTVGLTRSDDKLNTEISLTFNHRLSMLKLDTSSISGTISSVTINGLKRGFNWIASSNSSFEESGEASEISLDITSCEAIVVPQQATQLDVELTLSDGTIYAALFDNVKFEAGKSRELSLKF